jgi:hypothetical protein
MKLILIILLSFQFLYHRKYAAYPCPGPIGWFLLVRKIITAYCDCKVVVKSLCLTKHYAMKAYGRMDV